MKPDFILIPYVVLSDKDLQPNDKHLYGIIYWLERLKDGKCIAGNKYLAEILDSSPLSVLKSLIRLEKRGYIERIFTAEHRKVRLEIKTKVFFKQDVQTSIIPNRISQTGTSDMPNGISEDMPNGPAYNNNISRLKDKEYTPIGVSVPLTEEKTINDLISLFKGINPGYQALYKIKAERSALKRLVKGMGIDKLKEAIEFYPKVMNRPYCPRMSTPVQWEYKIANFIQFCQQERSARLKTGVTV